MDVYSKLFVNKKSNTTTKDFLEEKETKEEEKEFSSKV